MTIFDVAEPLLIDGGLSTQLESMGHDLHDPLWTARTLIERPDDITAAHRAFIAAGAGIVISASYQVSRRGFLAAGLTEADADRALWASVDAARAAGDALVAASVGPFGAIAHDGGEYRGNYGLSREELGAFHVERLRVLEAARPDLLAIETIPDADEAQAIVDVLGEDLPAWFSFTTADGVHVRAGQRLEDAVGIVAGHPAVQAVGINCSEPTVVGDAIARIRAVTDLPIVVYPNAGGTWDPATGTWHGPTTPVDEAVRSWVAAGAGIVGGCCGTSAVDIAAMAAALTGPSPAG